jgi:integrase
VKVKLTAKAVAALTLPPGKTDHITWDSELPRFGYRLRLGADGKVLRTWVVQFKRAGRTSRLQQSAAALSAEQARAWATRLVAQIALGQDPQADRIERRGRDRVTLKAMVDEYLLQKESRIRPRTFTEVKRYLSGDHFKPLFGMPVDQVSRRDVAARLVVITREHSSIVAARARATLSAFFVWCLQSGLVEANPVIGTLRPLDSAPRERLLALDELASVWRACDDGSEYGKIVRLLILLAARRGEVGGMAWTEFSDLDGPAPAWTLPARRSKNSRARTLPLGPMAVDIIKSVPRLVSRDALFGGRAGHFTAWGRNKQDLDRRSGVTGWVAHDLRRSSATHLGDMNIAPHIVEEILGHAGGHVRSPISRVYNRSKYFAEVHSALLAWEDRVRSITEGTARKVVPMTPNIAT